MICLELESYCQRGCPEFEADVSKIDVTTCEDICSGKTIIETTIRCEHATKCKIMYEEIRK